MKKKLHMKKKTQLKTFQKLMEMMICLKYTNLRKAKIFFFPLNKKNRLIFEERRHLAKEEKMFFVATENLLANEETSREEKIADINREPVVIVSF